MTSKEPRADSAQVATGVEAEQIDLLKKTRGKLTEDPKKQVVVAILADLSRSKRIMKVLLRHGFHQFVGNRGLLYFFGKRFVKEDDEELVSLAQGDEQLAVSDHPSIAAKRFRKVLEELGPTFIKLGQVLSTRPDLMPPSFIDELSHLQDSTPAVAFEEIREVVEKSLGGTLAEKYARFNEEPLASASIAQVHRARTHEGDEVVVKIIRPNIEHLIQVDMDLLHLMAYLLEASFSEMELYSPGEIVATFDRALMKELDLNHEADIIEEFANFHADMPQVAIPKIYRQLCSKKVLTMEYLKGCKVSEVESGSPFAKKLVEAGLQSTFSQIFDFGLYHGDPHPGNLLALEDGRLGLIDFGMIGRLTPGQQETLINLMISVITGDDDGIARVILRMGKPMGHIDMTELRELCADIRGRYLRKTLAEIDAAAFVQELINAGQDLRIRVTSEFAILAKAAVTVEGVLRRADPDIDIVKTARPFVTRLLQRRYSGRRLLSTGVSTMLGMASFLKQAPQQFDQLMMDLNSGTLTVQMGSRPLEELSQNLNVLTTRLFMAVLSAGLYIASAVLVKDDPWELWGIPVATVFSFSLASFLAMVGLAWHAVGAGSGKLSLSFLAKLVSPRRRLD